MYSCTAASDVSCRWRRVSDEHLAVAHWRPVSEPANRKIIRLWCASASAHLCAAVEVGGALAWHPHICMYRAFACVRNNSSSSQSSSCHGDDDDDTSTQFRQTGEMHTHSTAKRYNRDHVRLCMSAARVRRRMLTYVITLAPQIVSADYAIPHFRVWSSWWWWGDICVHSSEWQL